MSQPRNNRKSENNGQRCEHAQSAQVHLDTGDQDPRTTVIEIAVTHNNI